jgi:hypothetical protein
MEASRRGRKMRINNNVLLTFPPRPLTDWEQETLRGWLEAVDGFTAFVSQRRRDDPAIYRRIVISRRRTKQHAYTIHAPQGVDAWIVVSVTEGEDIASFPTLRAALEFVQPLSVGTVAPA